MAPQAGGSLPASFLSFLCSRFTACYLTEQHCALMLTQRKQRTQRKRVPGEDSRHTPNRTTGARSALGAHFRALIHIFPQDSPSASARCDRALAMKRTFALARKEAKIRSSSCEIELQLQSKPAKIKEGLQHNNLRASVGKRLPTIEVLWCFQFSEATILRYWDRY